MKFHHRLWISLLLLMLLGLGSNGYAQSTIPNEIAFAVQYYCDGYISCPKDIKIIDPDNGSSITINTDTIDPLNVAFSPDGQILSYLSSNGILHLFDMQAYEQLHQLHVNFFGFRRYQWSPDSNTLAIIEGANRTSLHNLYFLDIHTGTYEQITSGLNVVSASWSPDSSQILLSASEAAGLIYGSTDIYLLDLETSEMTNITNHPGYNHSPDWSSDGSRFVYVSGETRPERLVIRDETRILQKIEIDADWFGSPQWVLDDQSIVLFVQEKNSILGIINLETETFSFLSGRDPITGFDISGDGEHLVYITTAPTSDLCTIDLTSGHKVCFGDEPTFFFAAPVWRYS